MNQTTVRSRSRLTRPALVAPGCLLAVALGVLLAHEGRTPLPPEGAKAASGSPPGADEADRIARLVKQLGSDAFQEREAASRALDALGEAALPALRRARGSVDPEVRRRAAELVGEIEGRLAPAQRQRAITAIKGLGGHVSVDAYSPEKPVVTVDYTTTRVTDAGLEPVRWFPELTELQLSQTAITDEGLAHLRGLGGLQYLECHSTGVTDEGLAHLRGLGVLRILNLGATKVTDAGLENLSGLTRLEILCLAETGVSDAGLAHLHKLPRLRKLDLSDTKVTDAGVAALRKARPGLDVKR